MNEILIYSFVLLYAPQIWLDVKERFYPCSVEYYQNYTHIEGEWIVSNIKPSTPSSILSYFYGQNPVNTSVPIYAIILPGINEENPVKALKNPLNHSIVVTYFTLYPYNRGKEILDTVWDNHIGDIEHIHIYFTNGKPVKVVASYHAWNVTKKWGEGIEIFNYTHPVLYAARNSHGLWFTAGEHEYISFPKLIDYTSKGVMWNTWNNVNMIFPWNWNRTYSRKWNSTYLTSILRWGDSHTEFPKDNCYDIYKYEFCRFEDGPVGFLGKEVIQQILRVLVEKGLVYNKNCLWEAGIYG